jgi:uncharacterized membrane protein
MNQKHVPYDPFASIDTVTHIVYGLQAAGMVLQITWIAAIIINYVKRDDAAADPLCVSHFRWQIRTFWFGLMWMLLGGITTIVGIGFIILGVNIVWLVYRIVRGWLNLADRKPMYVSPAPAVQNE